MNNNTLEIRVYEEINIIDIFCSVKKFIKKIIKRIKELKNEVIKKLFGNINNYSNPPNKLIRTKLNKSFKEFSFTFVLYN